MDRGEIVIRVGEKEFKVNTPFSFGFYFWLFQKILPDEYPSDEEFVNNFVKKLYLHFNDIQSYLTGLDVEEIVQNQTVEQLDQALADFENQFLKEVNSIPFQKALRLVGRAKVRVQQKKIEIKMSGGES